MRKDEFPIVDKVVKDSINEVLDKIRAEIQKLPDINPDYPMDRREHICKGEALYIIDKYRAESEDKGKQ